MPLFMDVHHIDGDATAAGLLGADIDNPVLRA
jgi:hypothetical protein